ncbi:MAG TPA: hypothetical protein VF158_10285 [Longimicrobiales bacterium]
MGPSWHSHARSPARRRRLTLALATAEERLIEAYAEAAREFLRAVRRDLPYERALEIFCRLTGTPERIRMAVTVQALAGLADEPDGGTPAFDFGGGLRGMARELVARLKGRRAEGLRLRVDRAAGRARDRIEGAYLQGASMVVQELQGEVPPAEAVQVYLDALEIGPGWGERIFHEAVAAMGRQACRPSPAAGGAPSPEAGAGPSNVAGEPVPPAADGPAAQAPGGQAA